MLESLIGNIYSTNLGLPLQYGQMYQGAFNNAYSPLMGYYGNQANNMTSLGNQAMGLYGTLSGQALEANRFNALAPALAGLLNQFGGFGGGQGLSIGNISSPLDGYNSAIDGAYQQAKSYDGRMETLGTEMRKRMLGAMPKAPYMSQPGGTFGSPNPPAQAQQPGMPPSPVGSQTQMRPYNTPGADPMMGLSAGRRMGGQRGAGRAF